MKMVWADEDGDPVQGSPIGWLDPLIILSALLEAVFRALSVFFGSWVMLLMRHENDKVERSNALELAAIELETIGDEEDSDG